MTEISAEHPIPHEDIPSDDLTPAQIEDIRYALRRAARSEGFWRSVASLSTEERKMLVRNRIAEDQAQKDAK